MCIVAAQRAQHSAEYKRRLHGYDVPRSTSLAETVAFVEEATGKRARIERLPPQPGDIDQTCADIALAGRELGFSPQVELPIGIRSYVDWWRRTGSLV